MWIQVRTIDGKKTVRVDSLSKLTKIEELRKRLVTLFDAQPSEQRLFYRGKQVSVSLMEMLLMFLKCAFRRTNYSLLNIRSCPFHSVEYAQWRQKIR